MQLTLKLTSLAVLAAMAVAGPAFSMAPEASVRTNAELDNWLRTTDANLTFIGSDERLLIDRDSQLATLVYCTRRSGTTCGGECTIYRGISTCINAPHTDCLWSDFNVGYCDSSSCVGSCHSFNACGTRLDSGFCFTPGTESINVPFNL